MGGGKASWVLGSLALAACLACSTCLYAQDNSWLAVAPNSKSFAANVARLHSNLDRKSVPAEQIPGPASDVFQRLLKQVSTRSSAKLGWELRVIDAQKGNAFSLPDGSVYVDQEMVQWLANSAGLWAALLSHEIAHVTGNRWATLAASRRLLLDSGDDWKLFARGALPISALPDLSRRNAEEELAAVSQDLELQADAGALQLMARSGFHPDFMVALYHLMKVEEEDSSAAKAFCATHPSWAKRESKLRKRHSAAIADFNRLWPDPANSPGGQPPVLAFTETPQVTFSADRKNAEIGLPLRCDNSSGLARVVLLIHNVQASNVPPEQGSQFQKAVPCTPNQTFVAFGVHASSRVGDVHAEFYVMDDRGWVLARSQTFRVEY